MKPILFYAFSMCIAIVLLPIILFFALLIYFYDRHNPFFLSKRVGKDGVVFQLLKLRSMCIDSYKYKSYFTAKNDPRITPIGKFIRKFKIDEFPQIFNVLKGDINIVGPRPQVEIEVKRYTAIERNLLKIKPGITDISSIVFYDQGNILNGAKNPDLLYIQIERPWKSRLGLLYIQHASLTLDLKIIFFTFTNFFARKWTLRKLSSIVKQWSYDVRDLPEIVARTKPLYPYPVPGTTEVIQHL